MSSKKTPAKKSPAMKPAAKARKQPAQADTAAAETATRDTTPVEQPVEQSATEPVGPLASDGVAEANATPTVKKTNKEKPAPKPKKLSAIDAAARVLAEAAQPMTCHEMIEAMTKKGVWTTPGGQTPHATLYSAILREIAKKGKASRFTKTERGKFVRTDPA